jgi:hypothetical protein
VTQPNQGPDLNDGQDLVELLKQVGKLVNATSRGSAVLIRPDGTSVQVSEDAYRVVEAVLTAMAAGRRNLVVQSLEDVIFNDMERTAPAVLGDRPPTEPRRTASRNGPGTA